MDTNLTGSVDVLAGNSCSLLIVVSLCYFLVKKLKIFTSGSAEAFLILLLTLEMLFF
uniref:Uncharacterized protein n=1 Tax=Rhizophora mucronata TaxID=61149 RepID=A0A2P2PVL0_RHIMU